MRETTKLLLICFTERSATARQGCGMSYCSWHSGSLRKVFGGSYGVYSIVSRVLASDERGFDGQCLLACSFATKQRRVIDDAILIAFRGQRSAASNMNVPARYQVLSRERDGLRATIDLGCFISRRSGDYESAKISDEGDTAFDMSDGTGYARNELW
jgi:hypothetical protein